VTNFASLRRAVPGDDAKLRPLEANPLSGAWTSSAVPMATIQLPAFSQVILIDPATCPNCLSMCGDYNGDWRVDANDYNTWRYTFGTAAAAADGNRDGIVDAADFTIWRKALNGLAYGSSSVFVPTAVPEASSALGILGASAATFVRRSVWR
jgi:hypothetical protein